MQLPFLLGHFAARDNIDIYTCTHSPSSVVALLYIYNTGWGFYLKIFNWGGGGGGGEEKLIWQNHPSSL